MAQSDRKTKAVLRAAVEWQRVMNADDIADETVDKACEDLQTAVSEFLEVQELRKTIEAQPAQDAATAKFVCPYCDEESPPYGFTLSGGDLGLVGAIQYLTCYCGKCRAILAVLLTKYQPTEQLAAQLAAMAGGKPGGPLIKM